LQEQLGTQANHREHPSQALDQHHERPQRTAEPVARRLGTEKRPHRLLAGAACEGPEAHQNPLCRRTTAHLDGSMAVEEGQVQNPLRQAPHPLVYAGPGHTMTARHLRNRAALVDFADRGDDVGNLVRLAWKQVARQDPLARSAEPTKRQADSQQPEARRRLHSPLDRAACEAEVPGAAATAHAPPKSRVSRTRQDLGVSARIHGKDVHHSAPSNGLGAWQTDPGPYSLGLELDFRTTGGYRSGGSKRYGMRFSNNVGHDSQMTWARIKKLYR
jgi:hypothetical protein